MSDRPHSRLLAEFVSDFPPHEIPPVVLERTRQSVLDCIAAAKETAIDEHATGSRNKPMADEDLRNKLLDAGEGLLSPDALNRLVHMAAHLDDVQDIADLVRLTTVGG